ncbi:MAG: hypothetical protein ACFBSC_20375 [Microcoleaceae cyanobacterium]
MTATRRKQIALATLTSMLAVSHGQPSWGLADSVAFQLSQDAEQASSGVTNFNTRNTNIRSTLSVQGQEALDAEFHNRRGSGRACRTFGAYC